MPTLKDQSYARVMTVIAEDKVNDAGKANTHNLTQQTELSRDQIRHRTRKLERMGLIEHVGYDDDFWSVVGRPDPRLHALTDEGWDAFNKGLQVHNEEDPTDPQRELRDRVEELESTVANYSESIDRIDDRSMPYLLASIRALGRLFEAMENEDITVPERNERHEEVIKMIDDARANINDDDDEQ